MKKNILIFLVMLAISIAFYGDAKEPIEEAADSGANLEGITGIIDANNQFAFELYSELKDENDNLFFSPYSLSVALAMTYEGAKGKTAEEMQEVFHFPKDSNMRRSSFAKIYNRINGEGKKYQLNTANALWAQKNYKFLDEYLNLIAQYYAGKTTNLDFENGNEREKSRKVINKWVEEQTKEKIKDLIRQGILTPLTRLVLTNAIYFKGEWVKQFKKKNTREESFKIDSEKKVKVPMMSLTGEEAKFNYAETKELQILEMPYDGKELSMLVLLPRKSNLETIEQLINAEKLAEWKKELRKQRVDVYIPKFKFETKYTLNENLSAMGMPTAFMPPSASSGADFSGMNGTKSLYIAHVIHQAFVDVNEEGTEAAAATAVVMAFKGTSESRKTFNADHPFIFIIQERTTGTILFLGRVVAPAK